MSGAETMPAAAPGPHVAILMAVRDGARFLPAQLDSIAAQRGVGWSILAGDDGSSDGSRAILDAFGAAHPGRVTVVDGPRAGNAAANFLTLLASDSWSRGAYVTFCDQDDVWMPDRLPRALSHLAAAADHALYASRTMYADADARPRRPSARLARPPDFANALVQNALPGHTLLAAPALADAWRGAAPSALAAGVENHDWWAYALSTGIGARIAFDDAPSVLYRQHGRNAMGVSHDPRRALGRLRALTDGTLARWLDQNVAALRAERARLTPGAAELLNLFADWRAAPSRARPALRRLGLRRQGRGGQALLELAARLGAI